MDEYVISKLYLGATFTLLEVLRNETNTTYMLESEGHQDHFQFSKFSETVLSYVRSRGHFIYECNTVNLLH
jgi:hypothetical protein